MLRSILILLTGVLLGILSVTFYNKYQQAGYTKYIELREDFTLDNGSVLKRGCMLKIDNSSNENFTRYLLNLNYKGGKGIEAKVFDKGNLIKPYWMYRDTSLIK